MLLGIINKDKGVISWNGKDVKKHANFGYMPEEKLSKVNQQKVQSVIAVMHNTELLKKIILKLVKKGKRWVCTWIE